MWTYRARIIDVIDSRTVDVEIDLGFHIRTEKRITLVPSMRPPVEPEAVTEIESWISARATEDHWPLILTANRITDRGLGEDRECYVGTITTPSGDSLNEHLIRWADHTPF